MWWEHVAELAYKMALDCGQAHDFFEYIDELSQHNASHQKISSQTAMSTLLGNDWRTHRKRGRDPIRRISSFNGLLDDNGHGKEGLHPESVLVKRSKHHEPTTDTIRPRSLSPMSILRNTPVGLDERRTLTPKSSLSPVQMSEKPRLKPVQKEALRLPYQRVTSNLSQQKSKSTLPKTTLKKGLNEMTSLTRSPEKKTRLVDEQKSSEDARDDEKKPTKSPVRTGKPGMAEKKQKTKKRRSSKADKQYVVNRLKDVKENENGELVYLVEWEGNWDDTWEPFHCICHLGEDIKQVYKNTSQEMQAAMRLAGHLDDLDSD